VDHTQNDSKKKMPATKKPYRKPVLWVYGDIGLVTAMNMMGTVTDGGGVAGSRLTG